MTDKHDPTPFYSLGVAVILAAVLISASVFFAVGGLEKAIASKEFSVNVQSAGTGSQADKKAVPSAPAVKQPSAPSAPQKVDVNIEGKPIRGNENAKVTIVEFSDFECPFCGRAAPTVEQVLDKYGDDVKFVYMHFPLPFHQSAQKAAEAYECAIDQGKGWEYHDTLFSNQKALGVDNLKQYASDLGLDTDTFNSCLDSGEKASIVSKDAQQGNALGVSGTPTFYINGQKIVGAQPLSAFTSIIDAELAK